MKTNADKLLIKPGKSWLAYNAPSNFLEIFSPLPEGSHVKFNLEGNFDGILLFVLNTIALKDNLPLIAPLINTETVFWIIYPKKTSGVVSDLAMMNEWAEPTAYGLRTVSAASIDNIWTALRFRPTDLTKVSVTRNDKIRDNEFSEFIDIDKRQVKLPPEVEHILCQSNQALNFYQSLSYSNKKEYVIWILSAKQEKTKNERLNKLIEKLLAGKKNPSEK